MTMALLALLLSPPAHAQANSPYFLRGSTTPQATGAVNANYLDQTQRNRDVLVKTVADVDCSSSGGALTGATEKGGYIYGGACTAIPASVTTTTGTILEWARISSFSVSGVSVTTITLNSNGSNSVFQSSTNYKLKCNLQNGSSTNGDMGLVFGNGTSAFFGAFYGNQWGTDTTGGTGVSGVTSFNGGYIQLHGQTNSGTMQANSGVKTECEFASVSGSTQTVSGFCRSVWSQQAGTSHQSDTGAISAQFNNKIISSIAIAQFTTLSNSTTDTIANTWSGHCELYTGMTYP